MLKESIEKKKTKQKKFLWERKENRMSCKWSRNIPKNSGKPWFYFASSQPIAKYKMFAADEKSDNKSTKRNESG